MNDQEVRRDLDNNFFKMKLWYERADVKYELIKFLKNREFAFLMPKWLRKKYKGEITDVSNRFWRVHSIQHFDTIMNTFIFNSETPKVVNTYTSCGHYVNGMPFQTLNLTQRNNDEWKQRYWKEMEGYDILVDVDAKTHTGTINHAYPSTKILLDLFDKHKIAYELRFSGMGFHIVISSSALPKMSFDPNAKGGSNIYSFILDFFTTIKVNVTQIVDFTILDSLKLCKLPYSLAIFEKKCYVCTPILSREEFDNFKLSNYSFENMMHKSMRGRGTFLFNAQYKDIDNVSGLIKKLKGDANVNNSR